MNTNEFLNGGRKVMVHLLDGSEAEFTARVLTLKDYPRAIALFDDEIELTAFICGHDREWIESISPESYEALRIAAREVNAKGFFVYADRQQAAAREENERAVKLMAQLPPEVAQAAIARGSAAPLPKSPRRLE